MRKMIFSAVIAMFFISCDTRNSIEKATEIETTLIDGSPFKLSQLKGKYVVLDFWGSWCGPCIRDIPALLSLHQKYGDQVEFVTIALEKGGERWKSISEKNGFAWKYQIKEEAKIVLASPIARDYGVTDIPAKFIVTPNGELISGMSFEQMDAYLSASLSN